jgi:hypothetical protein
MFHQMAAVTLTLKTRRHRDIDDDEVIGMASRFDERRELTTPEHQIDQ